MKKMCVADMKKQVAEICGCVYWSKGQIAVAIVQLIK